MPEHLRYEITQILLNYYIEVDRKVLDKIVDDLVALYEKKL